MDPYSLKESNGDGNFQQYRADQRRRETRGDIRQFQDGYSRRRSPNPNPSGTYNDYMNSSYKNTQNDQYYRDSRGFRDSRDSRDSREMRDPRANSYRQAQRDKNHDDGHRRYGNERPRGYRGDDQRSRSPGRDRRKPRDQDPRASSSEQKLTGNALFERYEKRLINLLKVPTLSVFPNSGSQWGIKPKGFETITAQRAKLSGYFPLPSAQGSTETKLEDLMKAGAGLDGVLKVNLKIDPIDSRAARILVLRNVNASKIPASNLSQYISKFLRLIDLDGISVDENIMSTKLSPAKDSALIEFKHPTGATLALALNGKTVRGKDLGLDSSPDNLEYTFSLSRPKEYVVQCLPPRKRESKDVSEDVVDSPGKLTLHVDKLATETQLQDALNNIAPLRAFKLLREIGTKDAVGIAFAEFYLSTKEFPDVSSSVKKIRDYCKSVSELPMVHRVEFLCLEFTATQNLLTSVQDCFIELNTLKGLVRNKFVPFHPKLKVVQLINALTLADFASSENLELSKEDIRQEASKFGKVVSMRIPQPDQPIVPGTNPPAFAGIGKVFLEYEDESIALKALMGMAGRSFNDRTILCAFFDHEDYLNGIF